MIEVKKLSVDSEGKPILRDVDLTLGRRERVLLMGPNGSGKTSLARVLMGDEKFKVVEGSVELVDGDGSAKRIDLLQLDMHKRAQLGVFLAFQNPIEIPGVSVYELMYAAFREMAVEGPDERVQIDIDGLEKKVNESAQKLGIDEGLLNRGVNEGFSGGEKKKMELLQMLVLEPKYVILDEPDSGLDADSVKLVPKALDLLPKDTGILVISHDVKRLGMTNFDRVVVIKEGRIVKEVGKAEAKGLINEVAKFGYEKL